MSDRALGVLAKQLREKREQLVEALAAVSAQDYAEYRAICGERNSARDTGALHLHQSHQRTDCCRETISIS